MDTSNIRDFLGADLHDAVVALRDAEGDVTLTLPQAGALLDYVFSTAGKMVAITEAGEAIDTALDVIHQATRFTGAVGE